METNSKVKTQKSKVGKAQSYIFAIGRRREAVARIRLYTNSKGGIIVNSRPVEEYFSGDVARAFYLKPFEITNTIDKFTTTIKVEGGGLKGQLGAVVHGISRALEKYDREKFRSPLKKAGLLTRDARARQRRMVGTGGKARRKKQSPKR